MSSIKVTSIETRHFFMTRTITFVTFLNTRITKEISKTLGSNFVMRGLTFGTKQVTYRRKEFCKGFHEEKQKMAYC